MAAPYSILIVGSFAGSALRSDLERFGYNTTVIELPELAISRHARGDVDVIIAALPLPGMATFRFCRAVRNAGQTPVLVAAPHEGWLEALNAGADDQVFVPGDPRELNACVEGLVRRFRGEVTPLITLQLGAATILVRSGYVRVEPSTGLTATQTALLSYLAAHAGSPVTAKSLEPLLVGTDGETRGASIDAELEVLAAALARAARRDVLVELDDGWCLGGCG